MQMLEECASCID
jgi:hypothetical protein